MSIFKHRPTGKRFLFIHIPRTAGRFIGANLLKNDCESEQGLGSDLWITKNGVEVSHYHREYYEKYLDVKDIPHFAVVRNPVDRFISTVGHIGIVDSKFKVDNKLLNYLTKGDGASKYFYHFRPQVEFISSKTHVWKYEDGMGKEFVRWLSGILDIDFSFSQDVEYLQDNNSDKIRKTSKIIDNLIQFYKKDIEQFYPELAA
tara:strand:+ start:327 stop:932 length:606 start_codon:yes stop_codon:yes gene_type:complete